MSRFTPQTAWSSIAVCVSQLLKLLFYILGGIVVIQYRHTGVVLC